MSGRSGCSLAVDGGHSPDELKLFEQLHLHVGIVRHRHALGTQRPVLLELRQSPVLAWFKVARAQTVEKAQQTRWRRCKKNTPI